jgi:hypothetical protein
VECRSEIGGFFRLARRAGEVLDNPLHAADPDELPPDQKVFYGRDDKIPGYKIVPKKP